MKFLIIALLFLSNLSFAENLDGRVVRLGQKQKYKAGYQTISWDASGDPQ